MSNSMMQVTRIIEKRRWAAILVVVCGLGLGCGGAAKAKSGLGDGKPPPPPKNVGSAPKVERSITNEARSDYMAAITNFKKQDKAGWSADACRSSAEGFAQVAAQHPKLVEARFMAGLSYHRCNLAKDAEAEYQQALQVDKGHALSLSNLGELYFQTGKIESAKQYWESAVQANAKVVAARINLAWLLLEQMRKTKNRSAWSKLEGDARLHLSSALAVDNDNAKAFVLYGLLYLEGSERNKSRLDLAKLLLDEGAKRDNKYPPLYNARGLLQMQRNNQGEALSSFETAVSLDGNFIEARMNVGNLTLAFRKYDSAEEQFTKVLQLRSDSYDAMIGLGIAQRGLGKLEDAESSYKKAISMDSNKGAAYFNLGVLYKDFLANKSNDDLKKSQQAYQAARKNFETYVSKPDATSGGTAEAKDNIADCDKIIKQLDEVMQAQAQEAQGGGQ